MTFSERYAALRERWWDPAGVAKIREPFAAEITLTDEGGGTFYITNIGGAPDMQPYDYRDSTVSLRLPSALLEGILSGETDAVSAFLSGELDAEGDAGHALALLDALKKKKRARSARA